MNAHNPTTQPQNPPAATHHVWSVDVIAHRAESGPKHAILVVIDNTTGECLALSADRVIGTEAVIDALGRLVAERGAPRQIRCDGGPESRDSKIHTWLAEHGIGTLCIRADSPRYRAQIEAFWATLWKDVLDETRSGSLQQIRALLNRWSAEHNCRRVRSGAKP